MEQDHRTGKPLIELETVSRVFPRTRVSALREVSIELGPAEHVAVTGPSGSGKSTLLNLAAGLDQPTAGRVFFEGIEPASPAEWSRLRARQIGFVFQAFHLIAGLTAAENVELPMFGVEPDSRRRRARANELLERAGLDRRIEHRISELSGGESQRVAVARALANSPRVIFADEPTGNLDSANAAQIMDLLEQVQRAEGIALVVVTHDSEVAQRASRVVRLIDGRVAEDKRRS